MYLAVKIRLILVSILIILPISSHSSDGNNDGTIVEDGAYTLPNITVTAQKRPTDAQKTPIPITIFNSEQINTLEIISISDLALLSPGLTIGNNSNTSTPEIYLRGIGTKDFSIGSDIGVGIYVDDVYIGRTGAMFVDLFDLERIEVLRGPQGTLFGRNTIGGAIQLISKQPTTEFESQQLIRIGNFDLYNLTGSLSGPIVEDRLLGRLSYNFKDRDGYSKNVFNDDRLADAESVSGSGSLLFLPTNTLSFQVNADFHKDRPAAIAYKPEITNPIAGTGITVSDPPFNHIEPISNFKVNHGDIKTSDKRDILGFSGRLHWDIDNLSLESITSFRKLNIDLIDNPDGLDLELLDLLQKTKQEQYSQEIRLSNTKISDFEWIAGLYFFKEKSSETATVLSQDFDLLLPADNYSASNISKANAQNLAIFGDGTYKFTRTISASVGLRYSYEEKRFELQRVNNGTDGVLYTSLPKHRDNENWDAFTPKIGIQFVPSNQFFWYGSISRGFKSGGYNSLQLGETFQGPFDPEFVTAYELGLKSKWLENRLHVNVAAFYNDHTDMQIQTIVGNHPEISNAAEAREYGFELEVFYRPIRKLDINCNLAVLETEFIEFINAELPTGIDVSGERLIRAPKFSSNLAIQYTIPISKFGKFILHSDYQYQSRIFFTETNEKILSQKGFHNFNGKATYFSENGRFSIGIFGKNLTDEEIVNVATDFRDEFGIVVRSFLPPRTYGMELGYYY